MASQEYVPFVSTHFDCVCNHAWGLLEKGDQANLRLVSKEAASSVDAQIVELTGITSDKALHAASAWAVFPRLQKLRIRGCADIAPLSLCTQLQELTMSGCRDVFDLAPLSTCTELLTLKMLKCGSVAVCLI